MHLCANISNFLILETFEDYDVPWRQELAPEAPRVKNGFYQVPTAPGWGIEIDEAVIAAHPEDPDAKLEYVCPRLGTAHVQVTHDPEVSRTWPTPSGIRIGLRVGRMQAPELAVERES